MERHLLGGLGTFLGGSYMLGGLDMLNARSREAVTPELMCQEEPVETFQFF